MEALKKTHNSKLTQCLIFYFQSESAIGSQSEEILFNHVKTEMSDMRNSGVVDLIIYTYVLTVLQMLKVNNYDLIPNYKKVDKILSIFIPDSERKTVLAQTVSYCIKGSLKLHENPNLNDVLSDMMSKLESL